MAKSNLTSEKSIEELKKDLGKQIRECRAAKSLRSVADAIGLSPSNLKYIEDGVNAPTAEVYERIIEVLMPLPDVRKELDVLYMSIRSTPPPDICQIMINNQPLISSLRILDGCTLTPQQLNKLNELLLLFKNNT